MKKRYQKDLSDLYDNIVNENVEHDMETNLNDPPAPMPASTVEGLKEPLDHGDEDVEHETISNASVTQSTEKKEKITENSEESEKLPKTEINNFTMSDKNNNIFDKLYSTIMENDDLELMPGEGPSPESSDSDLEDLGIDDGGEVTIKLSKDLAEELHSVLMDQLGGEGDADLGGGEEFGDDEDELPEGSCNSMHNEQGETEVLSTSVNDGKNNKVGSVKPAGGHADGKAGKDEAEPKPLGDHVNDGKSNKVGKHSEFGS